MIGLIMGSVFLFGSLLVFGALGLLVEWIAYRMEVKERKKSQGGGLAAERKRRRLERKKMPVKKRRNCIYPSYQHSESNYQISWRFFIDYAQVERKSEEGNPGQADEKGENQRP